MADKLGASGTLPNDRGASYANRGEGQSGFASSNDLKIETQTSARKKEAAEREAKEIAFRAQYGIEEPKVEEPKEIKAGMDFGSMSEPKASIEAGIDRSGGKTDRQHNIDGGVEHFGEPKSGLENRAKPKSAIGKGPAKQ